MPSVPELLAVALAAILWVGLPLAFAGFVVYAIVRYARWRWPGPSADPLAILAARYARGEIDDAEYERRRSVLTG